MSAGVITHLSGSLDEELEKARETLKVVDDSIKKLFGKEANDLSYGQKGRRPFPEHNKEDFFGAGNANGRPRIRRGEETYPDEPWEKRRRNFDGTPIGGGRNNSNFRGRPSRDEDSFGPAGGDLRGRLQSRIVTSAKEKSRDEVLAEQREDRSGLTRNRRMFGALLGTLQRFKQDETKLKDKEEKRAQIEAKLDEAAKNEREGVKKEKQQLIRDRKFKMTEIKRLEIKKTRLEELEQWERQAGHLSNFIRTETKPHIFYLPKIMNPVMDCKLEQSKQLVSEMVAAKRKECLEDIEKFEQKQRRYWEEQQRRGSAEQLDVDMEEELKEVMKTDDHDVTHPPEGEDFTVTVSVKNEAESDNENQNNRVYKSDDEVNEVADRRRERESSDADENPMEEEAGSPREEDDE